MAVTTIGFVYSTTTWRLREVIIPDNDIQLVSRAASIGQGRALWIVPIATYQVNSDHQALLDAHTGHLPANDRYAVIDAGGNVIGAVLADPVGCGDGLPGLSLVVHATAEKGWLYRSGTFAQPIDVTSLTRPSTIGTLVRSKRDNHRR